MSKILIIPLFIVALVSGPLFEILMGEILSTLSLVISATSTLLVLIINFLLQLRKINNKSRQLYIDLKNTKESVLKIKDQLAELQKRIEFTIEEFFNDLKIVLENVFDKSNSLSVNQDNNQMETPVFIAEHKKKRSKK